MKYIKQLLIILSISLLGEFLKIALPFPIPASIYGMVILFLLLSLKILQLEDIKDVGKFLLNIMPIMFIPAGVSLFNNWELLKPIIVPIAVIIPITIVIVMVITGLISQTIIRRGKNK